MIFAAKSLATFVIGEYSKRKKVNNYSLFNFVGLILSHYCETVHFAVRENILINDTNFSIIKIFVELKRSINIVVNADVMKC